MKHSLDEMDQALDRSSAIRASKASNALPVKAKNRKQLGKTEVEVIALITSSLKIAMSNKESHIACLHTSFNLLPPIGYSRYCLWKLG